MFSLETTGTEMLMRRETEGLTCYRLFMDVTLSQKEAREVNPLFSLSGWLYSTEYQSLMKKKSAVFQSKTLFCTLAIETRVENYFPSKVSKGFFLL